MRRTDKGRIAELVRQAAAEAEPETTTRASDDLVAVVGFRDPIYPDLKSTGRIAMRNI